MILICQSSFDNRQSVGGMKIVLPDVLKDDLSIGMLSKQKFVGKKNDLNPKKCRQGSMFLHMKLMVLFLDDLRDPSWVVPCN